MKIKYLLLTLLIASCAPTIKNFENYQKQFLSKTSFMPSKENLEGKSPKIAVFALDDNNIQNACCENYLIETKKSAFKINFLKNKKIKL